tara:strand:+ start:106 stop:795 length:690 start_codon:yes stop_codon:yes gene_type:complete
MTSRFLKDNGGNFIKGLNGKNLRYLFYKDTDKVLVKFKKNWSNNAISCLEACYGKESIEIETAKPRGRPKKNISDKKIKRKDAVKLKNSAAINDSSDEENERNYYFMNFKKNDRVKCQELEELGFGVICKLEIYVSNEGNKYYNAHVKYENDEIEICSVDSLKRARGRRPKPKFIETKNNVEESSDDTELSLIKIDGELYLIDSNKEVYDLDSTYLGWYDGETLKKINV